MELWEQDHAKLEGVDANIVKTLQNPLVIFCLISKHCLDDHVLSAIMLPLLLYQIFCVQLIEFVLLC